MWKYNHTNELYHYGVKGQKWGVRRYQNKDGMLTPLGKKARLSRESADEWDEMARNADARGKTKTAAKYRKNASQDREDASKYEKQDSTLRSAVKKYSKKYDQASEAQDSADQKWQQTKEAYKAVGKNAISRALKAYKNNTPEAKKYSKAYDDWSKAQDVADKKWAEARKEYTNTGRNAVSRVLNNIRYNPM